MNSRLTMSTWIFRIKCPQKLWSVQLELEIMASVLLVPFVWRLYHYPRILGGSEQTLWSRSSIYERENQLRKHGTHDVNGHANQDCAWVRVVAVRLFRYLFTCSGFLPAREKRDLIRILANSTALISLDIYKACVS